MKFYIIAAEGAVEPELIGPFDTRRERDEAFEEIYDQQSEEDVLWSLDVTPGGVPVISG